MVLKVLAERVVELAREREASCRYQLKPGAVELHVRLSSTWELDLTLVLEGVCLRVFVERKPILLGVPVSTGVAAGTGRCELDVSGPGFVDEFEDFVGAVL